MYYEDDMKKQNAFTLIEILVTIVVLSIVFAMALPSYRKLIADNRLSTYTNDFVAATAAARSEAVKRGRSTTLSADGITWNDGWVIKDSDGNTLRVFPALYTNVSLDETGTAATSIAFNYLGGTSTNYTFQVCDNRTGETGRQITINLSGRPTVNKFTCP